MKLLLRSYSFLISLDVANLQKSKETTAALVFGFTGLDKIIGLISPMGTP